MWPATTAPVCGAADLAAPASPTSTYPPGSSEWRRVKGCWRPLPAGITPSLRSSHPLTRPPKFPNPPTYPRSPAAHPPACSPPTTPPAHAPAVISIHLFITAYHGGRHIFRLCPNATATKACVEANPLQR